MGDFEFGSQEHIDGLSRKALEADFRFVVDRMREAEGEWERLKAENAELRELMWDLYCLAYPSTVEWEVSHETYNKYSPCKLCEKTHGGKSPCASTSKDLTEECCKPFQAVVIADRMREIGIEVE